MLVFVDELSEWKTYHLKQPLIEMSSHDAYQDTDLDRHPNPSSYSPGSPEISAFAQLPVPSGFHVTLTDLQYINVGKVPYAPSAVLALGPEYPYFCANHAPVTIESFSLSWPKNCGLSAMATTAFCTVLLVTSGGRCNSSLESICRVQEIPKTDVAGRFGLVRRRRVK